MSEIWPWSETEKRASESGVFGDKRILNLFEGYLRFNKDDTEYRLWLQDQIREAEYRKKAGDRFLYHPSEVNGIAEGDMTIGTETNNNTPYRIHLQRGPEHPGVPVINVLMAGPVGAGKTTLQVSLAIQAARL